MRRMKGVGGWATLRFERVLEGVVRSKVGFGGSLEGFAGLVEVEWVWVS